MLFFFLCMIIWFSSECLWLSLGQQIALESLHCGFPFTEFYLVFLLLALVQMYKWSCCLGPTCLCYLLFLFTKTSHILLSGVCRGMKTNPFRFGNDKMLFLCISWHFQNLICLQQQGDYCRGCCLAEQGVSKYSLIKKKEARDSTYTSFLFQKCRLVVTQDMIASPK